MPLPSVYGNNRLSAPNTPDSQSSPDSVLEACPDEIPAQTPTHRRQIALQIAAALLVLSLAWPYFIIRHEALPWLPSSMVIGVVALIAALMTRQRWWWCVIHAIFAPLACLLLQLSIDPLWFLAAFFLMLLVYRGAASGQIPLYLSNAPTAEALSQLIEEGDAGRFLDLGAGIGSLLRPLAKKFPEQQFTGIENAPATWLVGYLLTRRFQHITWRYGDLWKANLGDYDLVYCFLSPAPMRSLAQKAQREMRPGTCLVSNSFVLPDVLPAQVIELDDARQTQLFIYQF